MTVRLRHHPAAPRPGRARRDDGITIVVAAIFLTSLMVVTALVVDMGYARWQVRTLKSEADAAAVAAGYYLSGSGSAATLASPEAACNAALAAVKRDLKDFPASASMGCASLPADYAVCNETWAPRHINAIGTGAYGFSVEYPVPASDLTDAYRQGAGIDDGTPCERMAITLSRPSPVFFAGIVTRTAQQLTQTTVVKAGLDTRDTGYPALIVLERSNCGTVQASGQGGIWVKSAGTNPGWIHTDSAAAGLGSISSNCGSNLACNGTNYNIAGTALPASAGGGPSIRADGSATKAGRIGMYSLVPAVNGKPACEYPAGLSTQPVADKVVSRDPVDKAFNNLYNPYGTNISSLHAEGYAAVTGAAPAGSYIITGAECRRDNVVWPTNVFANCNNGFSGRNVVFLGQENIFTGPLQVSSGYVAFPNARHIWVGGCGTGGGGCAAALDLGSGGQLSINTPPAAPIVGDVAPASWPRTDCTTDTRTPDHWTALGTFSGSFNVQNATGDLCQTTVYVGTRSSAYLKYVETVGGNCSSYLPCPSLSPPAAPVFNLNSGSAAPITWTAPHLTSGQRTTTSPLESLAMWTEGGDASNFVCGIGGQGGLRATGVYFYPNCGMNYAGQANSDNPLNAQFIGRALNMSGQGVFTLAPDPNSMVGFAMSGSVELIR